MTLSTQEIGLQNLAKLDAWLKSCESLPGRGTKVNLSAVALGAGVDRQFLYRPEAREKIALAVQEKGLSMPEQARAPQAEVPAWASQRILQLESQLTAARAEAHELRRRLQRYEHIDRHLATTGLLPR
ncbi:DUF6262 family protein [Rhizobium leguminosarum]|uniref:DUF6262 family protein n=1 Tax=Rhizobium leguminosarum TaxID=384 RepID=UPI00143F9860|nr:DUF6262 family protein [Rhizobium leguminosarum]NKL24930.1 hypothetical protein [Rhizobium leguminosarum bv. viciae]NKL59829.1 hypothetical protein [Rhizobium leguminosarum bv. viciae]